MDTAEAAPSSTGPRYAPDDPTLPQPWKGLIDGSTGLLYYWNPETNVTQYEKPAVLPPPLPSGPLPTPTVSTPNMNPVSLIRSQQPDGVQSQQNVQMTQIQNLEGQQMSSLLQQQTQLAPPAAQQKVARTEQQHGSQLGPFMQQQGHMSPQQFRPQLMQQPGRQMPPSLGQMPTLPGQQVHPQSMQHVSMQPVQQASYQGMHQMPHGPQGQIFMGAQMGHPHGYPLTPQQTQYTYQQNMHPQGPPASSQQSQHLMQGQQNPRQQEHKVGFPPRYDLEIHQVKQTAFSPAHIQQTGTPSAQNLSAGANSIHAPQIRVQPSQNTQYGPSAVNTQPSGADLAPQSGGSRFQNVMGSGIIHGQQQNLPPTRSETRYEENPLGRTGNEYYNTSKDGHAIPQHPKLAALPTPRNQQEMRMHDFPPQNVAINLPDQSNSRVGPPLHWNYSHATVNPPFPGNSLVWPPVKMGPSDAIPLSAAEVYCQQHEVTATGDNVPAPFMTFEATGFPPEILHEIHFAGFSAPTPIQAQTWPIALLNRDIVAIAKTGSGKTLGYLIPAFIHLRRRQNNPLNGPTVLVLAPTRELATQIQDEAMKFGRSSRVSCTCLYGGAPKGPQLKELDRGVDVVVATPGRLNDILEMKRIDFRQVSLLVLDEADRMLDMGFEPQIRKIVNEIPPRRQTLMYTATWPKEVRKIASDLLVNPVQVNIGSVDELAANKSITQKQRRLEQILRSQERGSKAIIFCSTKKLCDQVARSLGRNFGAAAIHGDKNQGERDWVLNQFRTGKSPVLVATDVASRGLDIRDIRVVINYDFPSGIEDYVHRIGRTGRAGATGIAYTFFSEQDWKYAADLVKVLEGANQPVPPEVREIALCGGPGFGKDRGGINHYDSVDGGGRWNSGGRGGMRDVGFGGRGGMRDGGFGGRSGGRDGGSGGRGGMRDSGFGGRGGMRDVGFGGCGGMRDGGFGGRGGGRRDGARIGWDRNERGGTRDQYHTGRGRGRFDNRRDISDRKRERSYSSSPERVRTWGYSRSRSSSRSSSRSRGRSYSRSRSLSRSRSYDRYERRLPRKSKFDQMDVEVPPKSGTSTTYSGTQGKEAEPVEQVPLASTVNTGFSDDGSNPSNPA
ncbi:DEAD-box ATP-dependent RNA helicase 40 [Olea europaea subsp. europaea]|uniref:RNA helicase n=1 Tax=Olea europaea subsp. europaea TaxID=158383 RepID=A0A8S0PF15_OLEEU|nr:DEAD-box ATP-dependent RNA helicase 40 [Olea europaea subsp. europaea]